MSSMAFSASAVMSRKWDCAVLNSSNFWGIDQWNRISSGSAMSYAAGDMERIAHKTTWLMLFVKLSCSTVALVLRISRRKSLHRRGKRTLSAVSRALVILGCIAQPLGNLVEGDERFGNHEAQASVRVSWASWCQRWRETTTMAPKSRKGLYYLLLKAGRWLAVKHPEALSPEGWNRELAIEFVAEVGRMTVGEWAKADKMHSEKNGSRHCHRLALCRVTLERNLPAEDRLREETPAAGKPGRSHLLTPRPSLRLSQGLLLAWL